MNRRSVSANSKTKQSCRGLGYAAMLVAALMAAGTGCRVMNQAATAVVPGAKPAGLDPAAMQTQVQRFSDDYTGRTSAALDQYADLVGTGEAREQALRWKISVNSAAV